MTTPNDAARPYCWVLNGRLYWEEENGKAARAVPLYTAADYDALRAEVDQLAEECAERKRLAIEQAQNVLDQVAYGTKQFMRAEAAEAKVAVYETKISNKWNDYDRKGPDYVLDGEPMIYASFLEELFSALNEGGE